MYACLYRPPAPDQRSASLSGERGGDWDAIARDYSPRYERHGDDLVTIDVAGLDRLLGSPRAIGEELRRDAASRGMRAHVAVAATQTAARLLALARPGLTVVPRGEEAEALAPIPIGILQQYFERQTSDFKLQTSDFRLQTFTKWGLRTLGDLAALPKADLVARFGPSGCQWPKIARGEDRRPLVPALEEERFDGTLELEWPIEGLEPLSFVLTRLLEPLSTRLERRDRGAAVLHVILRLTTKEEHARRLELPTPMRDVRTLRTLALLDLEAHPPSAAVDRVAIVIDPTPGRIVQHTLFARPHPTPEQLSTLVARLGALMGQDRLGAPAVVDSYRPGAFAMTPFKTEHGSQKSEGRSQKSEDSVCPDFRLQTSNLSQALRRCRQPVPARVVVTDGRPVRVTSDRRTFAGGAVVGCAGPWRSSGSWWKSEVRSQKSEVTSQKSEVRSRETPAAQTSDFGLLTSDFRLQTSDLPWNRDEWDVSLSDGAVYRIFQDRDTDAWFIDAVVD